MIFAATAPKGRGAWTSRRHSHAYPSGRRQPSSRACSRLVQRFKLRASRPSQPQVLVIGSSTGGPQALMTLLAKLPPVIDVPILVAQHMPATFTAVLAQHIARASGRPCAEAADNRSAACRVHLPRTWRLSSGDCAVPARHWWRIFHRRRPRISAGRPSIRYSAASRACSAPNVCAVMLTGMGSDGLDGARQLAAGWRARDRPGRSNQRCLGHAWRGCDRRTLLGGASIDRDRSASWPRSCPGADDEPRKLCPSCGILKDRSGLIITLDKIYLLETRLAPVLRKHGLPDLDALAAAVRVPVRLRADRPGSRRHDDE